MNPRNDESGEWDAPRERGNERRQYKSRKRQQDSPNPSNKLPGHNGVYRFHQRNRPVTNGGIHQPPTYGPDGYPMPAHMAQYLYSPPPPPPPPERNPNPPPKVHPAAAPQPKQKTSSQPHPRTLPQTYPAAPPQQLPKGRNMNGTWLPPFNQPGYRFVPNPNLAPAGWNGIAPGQFVNNFPVNQPHAPFQQPYPMGPLPQGPYIHQGPLNYGPRFQPRRFQQPDFVPASRPKPYRTLVENEPPCVECGIELVQRQVQDLIIDKENDKVKKARRRKNRAVAAARQTAMAKNAAIMRDEFDRLLKNSVRDVLVRRGEHFGDLDIEPEPHRRPGQLEYRRPRTPGVAALELLDSLERREQTDLTLQRIPDLISRTHGLELADDEHHEHLDYLQAQIDSLAARTAANEQKPKQTVHNHIHEVAGSAGARQRAGRAHSQPLRGRQNDYYYVDHSVRTPRSRSHRRRPILKTTYRNDSVVGDMSSPSVMADVGFDDTPRASWDPTEHSGVKFPEPRIRRRYSGVPGRQYQFVNEETYPAYDSGFYSDGYEGPAELRPRRSRPYVVQYAPEAPVYDGR